MSDILRALLFLEVRTLRRRLHSWSRSPAFWAAVVLLLACIAWMGAFPAPRDWDLSHDNLKIASVATLFLGGALCVSGWTSTLQSPIVVSLADASWVLIRPGGGRTFLLYLLLKASITTGLVAVPSGIASIFLFRLPTGRIGAVVVAAAVSSLAVRLAGYSTRVLYLRGIPLLSLRIAWSLMMLWILGLGVLRVITPKEPLWWDVPGQLLWALASTFARSEVPWLALFVATVVVIVVTLLTIQHCAGFEEEAIDAADQVAALMTTIQSAQGGNSALDALVNKSLRKGITSFTSLTALKRERAFLWRSIAQHRRQTKPQQLVAHLVLLMLISAAVARFAPEEFFTLPLMLSSFSGVLSGCSRGLAEEIDRIQFWVAPGSHAKKVWWVMFLPFAENSCTGLITGATLAFAVRDHPVAARLELAAIGIGMGLITTAVVCSAAVACSSLLTRVLFAFSVLAAALTFISIPQAAGWNLPTGTYGLTALTLGAIGVTFAWALAVHGPKSSHLERCGIPVHKTMTAERSISGHGSAV